MQNDRYEIYTALAKGRIVGHSKLSSLKAWLLVLKNRCQQ